MKKKMKETDLTLIDFIDMIEKSWTYNKMTSDEKKRLNDVFNDIRISKILKYNNKHKWDVLQAIYSSFLQGIGYDNFNWRYENEKELKEE